MFHSFLLKIALEALRGSGYRGDIAVDDVTVTDETCPPLGENFDYVKRSKVN